MRLCIPPLGQKFVLLEDWQFNAWPYYINAQIRTAIAGQPIHHHGLSAPPVDTTLPRDTVLKVMKVSMVKGRSKQFFKLSIVNSPDKRLVPPSKGGSALGGMVICALVENLNEAEVEFIP